METTPEKKIRKKGKRSPGYPVISLEEAVQKVKILWGKDQNNTIALSAAHEHLGYKAKGGYGARIIAALKTFDLISQKQDGIKLTSEAIDLALHDPSEEHYKDIVRQLALSPSIYKKLFDEYRGTVSDATLKIKLIKDYGFNPTSVDDFISTFRKTINFAGLTEGNALQKVENGSLEKTRRIEGEKMERTEKADNQDSVLQGRAFLIPLSKRKQATIAFESLPVDKKDIAAIEGWLKLFAPSLTEEEES